MSIERGAEGTTGELAVEVKPSGIEGLGLFACRPFDAGQRMRRINVLRDVTAEAPLRPERGERADHGEDPDGRVTLIGFPDRHINHSCDPNDFVRDEEGASFLVARRTIRPGEEITCDCNLNVSGGTSWPCRCGADRCLGTVTGDYFLLPGSRQREYRPLLADWFVRRHAGRLARVG